MGFSETLATVLTIRRIVVAVSILAGTGYKVGPTVWHKVESKFNLPTVSASAKTEPGVSASASNALVSTVTTNAAGIKISSCNLGAVTLTNHYETCVALGVGKECLLTPNLIDSHTVQLTVTVESKNAKGKIHDLSVTQVVAKSGKPFEVAVGDYSFSLTPNMAE